MKHQITVSFIIGALEKSREKNDVVTNDESVRCRRHLHSCSEIKDNYHLKESNLVSTTKL